MTFEELKYEAINRTRIAQVDKVLHLYIKAQSYSDLIRAAKSTGNFDWILHNGFRDLVQYIPVEELEAENIYSRDITLENPTNDVVILSGLLTITQSGTNRSKIVSDGGNINAVINDSAMLEFEFYQRTSAEITVNSFGFAYITVKDFSQIEIFANEKSTIKLIGWQNSVTNVTLTADSFLNSELNDDSVLNTNNENYYARQRDKSKVNIES